MILSLLMAQALVQMPLVNPTRPTLPPANPDKLSLVVVQTVSETDPRPVCAEMNCTSMFLGRYRDVPTLVGPGFGVEFSARIEMGSPWDRPYRLALIVEQRDGQEPLVRAVTGFSDSTGVGCFQLEDTGPLNWRPSGSGITLKGEAICVMDQPAA
jgi:hypothetical protein